MVAFRSDIKVEMSSREIYNVVGAKSAMPQLTRITICQPFFLNILCELFDFLT